MAARPPAALMREELASLARIATGAAAVIHPDWTIEATGRTPPLLPRFSGSGPLW
ncbi:MAG: hypothetical protein JWL93_1652 [Hyphomicrobiales bacterium]|nr:hypothetical protein [Hyphomicrobiales bacterium]